MNNYTVCPGDSRNWSDSYMLFNQILNGFLTSACVIFGSVGNIHSINIGYMGYDLIVVCIFLLWAEKFDSSSSRRSLQLANSLFSCFFSDCKYCVGE
uniref:Uncharacterized protein n=1 Tax=Acrobeloides nanus TaxID=290746 RepID=A0A914DF86_9BILA